MVDLKPGQPGHLENPPFDDTDENGDSGSYGDLRRRPEDAKDKDTKSWAHLVAGGVGGMAAACLTSPLDVVKTRLQSDFYKAQLLENRRKAGTLANRGFAREGLRHFAETFSILHQVYKLEGWRALFKGLGPNLSGVVPARAINFYVYGNGKRILANSFNNGQESTYIHLSAAAIAGIATSTATNPIWMIKTRLQLDKESANPTGGRVRQYKNSLDCTMQILRTEGFRGLYKGLSASYLGVAESTLQWVLYERMKKSLTRREEKRVAQGRERTTADTLLEYFGRLGAAGSAKLFAAMLTYPHEVVRTRLRQAPIEGGKPKYTGLVQCIRLVAKEEGMVGLYGGLSPHLLRVVPSAAIMFGVYEYGLKLMGTHS